jgi:hypothetical protein
LEFYFLSFKKNRKSLQNRLSSAEKQSNLSKSFNESLTEDDLKYLDDLDEKVHQNVGASLIGLHVSCVTIFFEIGLLSFVHLNGEISSFLSFLDSFTSLFNTSDSMLPSPSINSSKLVDVLHRLSTHGSKSTHRLDAGEIPHFDNT